VLGALTYDGLVVQGEDSVNIVNQKHGKKKQKPKQRKQK
jgi:hypothetical protein